MVLEITLKHKPNGMIEASNHKGLFKACAGFDEVDYDFYISRVKPMLFKQGVTCIQTERGF